MIEPVGARTVADLHKVHQSHADNNQGPPQPSAADQARFEAAMEVSQTQVTPQIAMTQRPAETASANLDRWVLPPTPEEVGQIPESTLGNRILDGMTGFRDGWTEMRASIDAVATNPTMRPAEMVKMLYQVQQATVVFSLVTNEVSQASRKIDGLLKTG